MAKSVEVVIATIVKSMEKQRLLGDIQPTTWRKLASLVSACGWKNRNRPRMEALAEAIAAAQLFASHDVTDLDLSLDTSVRFSESPFIDLTQIFNDESELGYHLSEYPAELEKALPHLGKLSHLHGGRKKEKTYFFQGSPVRPDLVFKSATGIVVVIELERGDPKDESVNQLERYLDAAAAQHRGPVSGVLITGLPNRISHFRQFGQHLDQLRTKHPDVTWLSYNVAVSLSKER